MPALRCFALLLIAVPALAQLEVVPRLRQRARPGPEGRMSGEFLISGAVVDASTGEPVRKATVRIHGGGADPADGVTLTDAGGTFIFRGLEPGSYSINAEKPGYAPDPAHANLTVTAGPEPAALRYKLTRQGVLGGKVRDENADPVPNALVQAFRKQVHEGRHDWVPAGGQNTNDVGEYRLAVPPGTYLISVTYNYQAFYRPHGRRIGDDRPVVSYPSVYYPNVTDSRSAVPVVLTSGQEQQADFNLAPGPMFQVRGRVTNAPAQRGMGLSLIPAQSDLAMRRIGANFDGSDGAFFFAGVTPGAYQLVADSFAGPDEHLSARQTITVGQGDVTGIEVTLAPAFDIPVHVRTEDGSPAPPVQVSLTNDASRQMLGIANDKDGARAIRGITAGAYRLSASAGNRAYIKSATLGGVDILDRTMEWNGPSGPIEITIGTRGGTLAGHISKGSEAVASADVVVLRGTPDGQYALARQVHATGADFSVTGLAPGNYLVLAPEDAQSLEYADAAVLKKYQDYTQTVSIEEKAEQHLQLKLAPAL